MHSFISRPLLFGLLWGLLCVSQTWAESGDMRLNGFASLNTGRVVKGSGYLVDYPHDGNYDKHLSFTPDSVLGLQGSIEINDKVDLTTQVVARGLDDFKAQVEWMYGTIKITPKTSVQIGRMRIPLFFYSDFFDLAYAYPWMRAPDNTYAWEVVNYNGANLSYMDNLGDWTMTSSLYGGREDTRNNINLERWYYNGDYYAGTGPYNHVDESWENMIGGVLKMSNDWAEFQASYMRTRFTVTVHPDDTPNGMGDSYISSDGIEAEFVGLTANFNIDGIITKADYNTTQKGDGYAAMSWMLGAGYQMGKWLPMYTYSEWKDKDEVNGDWQREYSFSLRYDFMPSAALKLQLDRFDDQVAGPTGHPFHGDARLVSVGLDLVF